MPTVLSMLELPAPESLDGVDLTSLLRPDGSGALAEPRFLYTEADFTYDLETKVKALGTRRTIRTKRFRLHLDTATGEEQLFDLPQDPFEQRDVASAHPEVTRRLREQLSRFIEAGGDFRAEASLSEEDERLLESLGYVQ
jgi:arylsulfatase A-like enzyme